VRNPNAQAKLLCPLCGDPFGKGGFRKHVLACSQRAQAEGWFSDVTHVASFVGVDRETLALWLQEGAPNNSILAVEPLSEMVRKYREQREETATEKIANSVFAIETNLDPLALRIREDRKEEALEVVEELRKSVNKIKEALKPENGEDQ
jgi:hypothetical protein